MTNKDHKKLESFHLTEAEKKALRDQDRADAIGNLILILSAIAITAVIVLVIMELAAR